MRIYSPHNIDPTNYLRIIICDQYRANNRKYHSDVEVNHTTKQFMQPIA